jgi:hypothetical protein
MSKTQSGWSGFWARLFGRGQAARDFGTPDAGQPAAGVAAGVDDLAGRVRRAAESILESEGLTGDLDDAAARALLEWGVACARRVAQATSGLTQGEAEVALAERLRAVRRLMRLVNGWAAGGQGGAGGAAWLDEIVAQAAIVDGQTITPPDAEQRAALLQQMPGLAGDPPRLIADLRALVEDAGASS